MGYTCHHAILVTSFDAKAIAEAHERASNIFGAPEGEIGQEWGIVSPLSPDAMNHFRSFAVFPDGSKEGWATSDEFDARRRAFLAYLREQDYEDGSSCLDWAEVQYGDDDGDDRMLLSQAVT